MGRFAGTTWRRITVGASAVVFAATAVVVFWDAPRFRLELVLERPSIEKAARDYLAAETARDYKKVYALLAPSSIYMRTHTYDDFIREVESSPVVIRSYRIKDIYRLRPNHDPEVYPGVERFVQVEVDIDVGFSDTGAASSCNYCFTFLKENGRWYKG